MNRVGFRSGFGLLVVGLLAASGWAAAEEAGTEAEPAGTEVAVQADLPLELPLQGEGARPPPSQPWRGQEPPRSHETSGGEQQHRQMQEELRIAAKELRTTFLGEFKVWKTEQRAEWQAEKAGLAEAYRAEVREIKAWWQSETAALRLRCAGAPQGSDPALSSAAEVSAPGPSAAAGSAVETGCGRERAAINQQSNLRLQAAREDARESKRALDAEFRERMEMQLEDLVDRLREALEDRMLDLRASMALDMGMGFDQGPGQPPMGVRGHHGGCPPDARDCDGPRDGPRDGFRPGPRNGLLEGPRGGPLDGPRDGFRPGPRDGPHCDEQMRCKPPPACEGQVGATAACTPPSVCHNLGDGTWQCPSPAEMAERMKGALGGEVLEDMHAQYEAGADGHAQGASS